jgi:hypothetical protein
MTRLCDICGAPISKGAGICTECGMKYLAEGEPDQTLYGCPRWGAIEFDLSKMSLKQRKAFVSSVKKSWESLENNTEQKLFPSQLYKFCINDNKWTLYGSYASFLSVSDELKNDELLYQKVNFTELSLDEIERIQTKIEGGKV